jgi:Fe-S cluster biosynthesis and repair protein YggX
MTRMVQCALLGVEAPGLDYQPYPGELGQRIYEQISAQAWQQWVAHQTMLINENRLTPIEPAARTGCTRIPRTGNGEILIR